MKQWNGFDGTTLVLSFFFVASISALRAQIVPPNWVSPKPLESAESPIQSQLDTGKAMTTTARSMADVRNARLFVVYMLLYQKLGKSGREELYQEQCLWLKNRDKQVAKLYDPNGGSDVRLFMAEKEMELTDSRIKELAARLEKVGGTL